MHPSRQPRRVAVSLALLSVLCGVMPASAEETPLSFGLRTSLHSEVLGEDRPLLVALPEGYASSPTQRFPVLYVLDGETHFLHIATLVQFLAKRRHMPEMLVVAVPNRDRDHDLTPTLNKTWRMDDGRLVYQVHPEMGGADIFLRFFNEELIPSIDKRYRTQPYRVLLGHSFGGLFALHALVHKPESFNAYLAISPSLQWNDDELVRTVPEAMSRLTVPGRALYLMEDLEETPNIARLRALTKQLRKRKPAALTWRFDELPGEDDHGTIPHPGTYAGLTFLFTGWQIPEAVQATGDLARIEAHYAGLTKRVGFLVPPPEGLLNGLGYRHLGAKRLPQALEAFERTVALYPNSANAFDSLADALEAAGRLQDALTRCERAVALGREHEDPHLPDYQKHADAVRARLAAKPTP